MLDSVKTPILCKKIPRIGNKFSQLLGTTVLRAMGWSYSGIFPCCSKMILTVAPHTSNWDFVVGIAVAFNLRLKISFFGKHSLFIPPFDRILRRWGGIPIVRTTKHGVVDGMVDKMREAKSMVLCLAPEGTRSPISPWKTGFLHIAHKANVPVFLVAFDYKKKLIEFGPLHNISDNTQVELNRIYLHFKQAQGKYPEKMITKVVPPVEKEIEK
ncbi:MAG: 1-acyl-sn-glycerol-3-phosphate acyltransferase [Paraglaciecola sp.]|jgi:1-acyl-sn-glycerol-3-phosphate acyltransferase